VRRICRALQLAETDLYCPVETNFRFWRAAALGKIGVRIEVAEAVDTNIDIGGIKV